MLQPYAAIVLIQMRILDCAVCFSSCGRVSSALEGIPVLGVGTGCVHGKGAR